MKRKVIMLLLSTICIGIVGCGKTSLDQESTDLNTQTSEEISSIVSLDETIENDVETEKNIETEEATTLDTEETIIENNQSEINEESLDDSNKQLLVHDENLDNIVLNEPYVMQTEYGDFSFTITEARATDWMNESGKEIVLLCYTVENQNYDPDNGSLLLLNETSFRLIDVDGNILEPWDMTMSEFGFPDFVEPGESKQQEQPYIANQSTTQIRVVFPRNGEEIADIVLPVS